MSRSSSFQKLCEGILVSERIDGRWVRSERAGWWILDVPVSDVERAAVVIGEVLQEDYLKREALKNRPSFDETMLMFKPAFSLGLCLALSMMVVFYFSGSYVQSGELYRRGVMNPGLIEQGQWWRLVTAATLHADMKHLLGNALFLWLLGWASAERLGTGVTIFGFVVTAVFGFIISALMEPQILSVGASGGLFGLLGLTGGHGLRLPASVLERAPRLRTFGAASLFGLHGFQPRVKHPRPCRRICLRRRRRLSLVSPPGRRTLANRARLRSPGSGGAGLVAGFLAQPLVLEFVDLLLQTTDVGNGRTLRDSGFHCLEAILNEYGGIQAALHQES